MASQREVVRWMKSNFLCQILKCGKDQWDCEIVNYYVAFPLWQYNIFKSLLGYSLASFPGLPRLYWMKTEKLKRGRPGNKARYSYLFEFVLCKLFWMLLVTLSQDHVLAQDTRLGSPDRFSSWEVGVWGQDFWQGIFPPFPSESIQILLFGTRDDVICIAEGGG